MPKRALVASSIALADTQVMAFRRIVIWGLVVGAVAGAASGLVLGLIAYPPTAWFAVVELGVPGAVVGVIAGSVVGLIVIARREGP